MKKYPDLFRFTSATLLLLLFLAPVLPVQSHDFDEIGTKRSPAATVWGAVLWTKTERDKFKGRPKMNTDSDIANFITVAYDRYVSYYDLKGHAPRWVAYVADSASAIVSEKKSRTGSDFARPSEFFTDGVVADACVLIGVTPTEHSDFSDCVPQDLATADRIPKTIAATKAKNFPAYIERGHLAPNNTMKTWGTPTKGKKAQFESFSLANVVPQMSAHNAPTWSSLEAQCLAWAKELGSVCVITGPMYGNAAPSRHIEERRTGEDVDIPFPESLFCVVIGTRAGKTSAIGFIMPHVTASYSFRDKAVTIDLIEAATGINFMPLLGEPNPLEQSVDQRWINN